MKHSQAGSRGWKMTLAASLAALGLTGAALAQPAPRAGAANPARTAGAAGAASAAKSPAASGEAAIEDRLMSAMAGREMDSLLSYYFKKHNIAPQRQDVIKSIVAWREMASPHIAPSRRRQLIASGIKGIDPFLASTHDTEMLMTRAAELIEYGMKGQVNMIEYFGESPSRQAELNDCAEAVVKMLDKTIEECDAQEQAVLANQTRPSPALLAKWQALDDRLQTAKWTKAFSSYALALSLDPANPRRKEIVDAAVTFLAEFEKPEYQREVAVKTQMGKLLMVKGDYAGALAKLKEAGEVKTIDKRGQYDVQFFTALAELLARDEKGAVASLDALKKWIAGNLDPNDLKAVAAGVGLLEYRIDDLRSELAKDAAAKKQFASAGEAVLSRLMKENPALEGIIKKMLLEKLPADADISKLDTVLLRALEARGEDEVLRAKDALVDARGKPVLERAVKSAAEIQKRAGQPNVTDDVLDEASFLESVFNLKLGNYAATVEESLDYLKHHGKSKVRVANALANALASVEILRKSPESTSEKVSGLIDRAWQAAIDAGMKEYAVLYGKRLFDQDKYKQAAEILKQTPANNPALTFARFYELSSLQERLNEKGLTPDARKALVAEIQGLAAEVNQRIDVDLAKADDARKPRLRFYQASTTLLSARLLQNEMKDNKGVLERLAGFEEKIKGMRGEDSLLGTALQLRVNAYMALSRTQDAVNEVKKLVAANPSGSAKILFNMIGQMDDAYAKAKIAGDKEAMQRNSAAQVALIDPLIAQTADPSIKNTYEQWKAGWLLRAAQSEDAAAKKSAYLSEAQATFTKLLKIFPPGSKDYDSMRYKLALISFELKDYKKVQLELGQLIADGKLGPPDIREVNPADGSEAFKENPVYWEGLLRFMQSNYELSKTGGSPQLTAAVNNARETLKSLYINRGDKVGGARYHDEYAQLKAELLPGWDPAKAAAATQPSAAAGKPAGK